MTLAEPDLESFCHALDQYGAQVERWPQPLAEQAQNFLTVSAEARDALKLAQMIATALQEGKPAIAERAPAMLASRIKAGVPQDEPLAPAWHWLLGLFSGPSQGALTATMACVPLVVGMWLGSTTDIGLSLEQNIFPDQSLVSEVDGLLFSLDDHIEVLSDDT